MQNDASAIDSRGTALVTQAPYHESSPRSTGMAINRRISTNKPRLDIVLVLQDSVCPISVFSDPIDSQSQLESISPPVGRPTTCIVTL